MYIMSPTVMSYGIVRVAEGCEHIDSSLLIWLAKCWLWWLRILSKSLMGICSLAYWSLWNHISRVDMPLFLILVFNRVVDTARIRGVITSVCEI